jgi:hypothetical protein
MSLTTLPALPAEILIRKTRAKKKNTADRVGGSSHHNDTYIPQPEAIDYS